MPFMTAASVRNLPNYMQEDRIRANERREEQRRQEKEAMKKRFGSFMNEVYTLGESAKSIDDVKSGFPGIRDRYPDLTAEMQAAGVKAAMAFKQSILDEKDRAYKEGRRTIEDAQKDELARQTSILERLKVDRFPVEAAKKDSLFDAQIRAENARTAAANTDNEITRLKLLQAQRGIPKGRPGSVEYNNAKLEYLSKQLKIMGDAGQLTPEALPMLKMGLSTEFDALQQNWGRVTIKDKGKDVFAYVTPNGLIDMYGKPIKERVNTDNSPKSTFQASTFLNNNARKIREVMKITGGAFDRESRAVIFEPESDAHLQKTLKLLDDSGFKFDVKANEDGTWAISVLGDKAHGRR